MIPAPRPLVCVCRKPWPRRVKLWGWVIVPGARECGRCGRRVWEDR